VVNAGDGKQDAFGIIEFLAQFPGYPQVRLVRDVDEATLVVRMSAYSADSQAWLAGSLFDPGRSTWAGRASLSAIIYANGRRVHAFSRTAEGNLPGRALFYTLVAELLFDLEDRGYLPATSVPPGIVGTEQREWKDEMRSDPLRASLHRYYWTCRDMGCAVEALDELSTLYSEAGRSDLAVEAHTSKLAAAAVHEPTTLGFEQVSAAAWGALADLHRREGREVSALRAELLAGLAIDTSMLPDVVHQAATIAQDEVDAKVSRRVERANESARASAVGVLQVFNLGARIFGAGLAAGPGNFGSAIEAGAKRELAAAAEQQLRATVVSMLEPGTSHASPASSGRMDTAEAGSVRAGAGATSTQVLLHYYVAQHRSVTPVIDALHRVLDRRLWREHDVKRALEELDLATSAGDGARAMDAVALLGAAFEEAEEFERNRALSRVRMGRLQPPAGAARWMSVSPRKRDFRKEGHKCHDTPDLRGDFSVRLLVQPMFHENEVVDVDGRGWGVTIGHRASYFGGLWRGVDVQTGPRAAHYKGWPDPRLPLVLYIEKRDDSVLVMAGGHLIVVDSTPPLQRADCLIFDAPTWTLHDQVTAWVRHSTGAQGAAPARPRPTPQSVRAKLRPDVGIHNCLESAPRREGLPVGTIVKVLFTIHPDGAVTDGRTEDQAVDDEVQDCLARELNGLRFPAFEGEPMAIRYSFVVGK